MAENREKIERIATNPEAPSFENTIEELERAGRTQSRDLAVYGVWSTTMNSPEFQAVERVMAPKLAALSDQITQNEELFERIAAVYEDRAGANLTPEQERLAWRYYTDFVRAGAQLEDRKS